MTSIQALQWSGQSLNILDQRLLPEQMIYNTYHTAVEVAEAIQTMQVRGAPAIGIAAAYGVALSVREHFLSGHSDSWHRVQADCRLLAASRPTAVNLFWALETMLGRLNPDSQTIVEDSLHLAKALHQADIDANHQIGEFGADLLAEAQGIMTHCNAGALATGGYGTALGVIRSAWARKQRRIYAGETRPWLQGARLTAWELSQDGIPVTLIVDSAAAWLMQNKQLDWIVVGADRIAANGDVANKIGTYALAVLAQQHGVKLMVAAPFSTLDFATASGDDIAIEQRDAAEILPECYRENESLVQAWNPVFDVTPAHLIAAIVTEAGVVLNPDRDKMRNLHECKKR